LFEYKGQCKKYELPCIGTELHKNKDLLSKSDTEMCKEQLKAMLLNGEIEISVLQNECTVKKEGEQG
jgi:uncharacterized protein (UPF0128 family)